MIPSQLRVLYYQGVLRAYIEGTGSTVVVLHGGPGLKSETVRGISRVLRDRYRVVRYDQGQSSRRCTLETLLDEIEILRRQLRAATLILAGHSWGAALASLYAATYPRRAAALALIHPLEIASRLCKAAELKLEARRNEHHRERARRIARELADPRLSSRRRKELEAQACALDLRLATAAAARGREFTHLHVTDYDSAAAHAIWRDLERKLPAQAGGGYDLTSTVRAIKCPAMVVLGEHDVIDARSGPQFARLCGADLERLANSGHWSFVEEPLEFRRVAHRFLARV